MINDKTIPSFITKLLPSRKSEWRNFFIAGGFVVNPHLAMDVDLWFPMSWLKEVRDKAIDFDYTEAGEPYEQPCGEESVITVGSVVTEEGTLPIHLLATNASVFSILGNFDLSVHQVAETLDGFAVLGPDYTYPTEAIEVLGYWTPRRTLGRYKKLCARYGMGENPDEIKRLEDKIESSSSAL